MVIKWIKNKEATDTTENNLYIKKLQMKRVGVSIDNNIPLPEEEVDIP